MTSFKDLSLSELIQRALGDMKYSTPTEIQAKAIPVALAGRDVVGSAQTGTGKTAAFSIPLVETLLKHSTKRALILAPTRELVMQIDEVLRAITRHVPSLGRAVLIGGAPMGPQFRQLSKSPRIIIATPGRLMDHVRRRSLSLAATELLVLDEADRMLDMGFARQLDEIFKFLPKNRQTMLFSATYPQEVQKLISRYTREPARILVGPVSKPIEKIQQSMIETTMVDKKDTLLEELEVCAGSVLVFTRTKSRADAVSRHLKKSGFRVDRIHGDRTQRQRIDAIEGFKRGKFDVLVATDIAARGIDIPHIANVINYDLPMTVEDYVHRIGRTGRAGADGRAVSFVTPEDRRQWRAITKHVAKTSQVNAH